MSKSKAKQDKLTKLATDIQQRFAELRQEAETNKRQQTLTDKQWRKPMTI